MSQMPDSIYLHKDSKYNTSGEYFARDEVRILSENEFDENALKDYVEYTPVYRLEEAIREAEKDTLKRAVEWWRPRLQGILSPGLVDGIIEEFRNGMK